MDSGINSPPTLSHIPATAAINPHMNGHSQKENPSAGFGIFSLLCCACIGALIAFVLFRYSPPRAEPPRRLWWPVVVNTNGGETVLGDYRQFEFWTPSVKTRDYLHTDGAQVAAQEKWEVLPNEDAVLQF